MSKDTWQMDNAISQIQEIVSNLHFPGMFCYWNCLVGNSVQITPSFFILDTSLLGLVQWTRSPWLKRLASNNHCLLHQELRKRSLTCVGMVAFYVASPAWFHSYNKLTGSSTWYIYTSALAKTPYTFVPSVNCDKPRLISLLTKNETERKTILYNSKPSVSGYFGSGIRVRNIFDLTFPKLSIRINYKSREPNPVLCPDA